MSNLKVILDTNVILRSISRRSAFSILLDKIYDAVFEVYVTNDILLEYEEKITDVFSKETAELVLSAFTLLPNVKKVEVHFHLGLIHSDIDDNKFVDCAFAANAHYLVSNDRHFNVLNQINFPNINVITLEKFVELLF
jgi:uncharacterized protein